MISRKRDVSCTVNESGAGRYLLDYITGRFTYRSRDQWQDAITTGELTVNSRITSPNYRLALDDRIALNVADYTEPEIDLSFSIVYENRDFWVIDKPANLPVHPSGVFFYNTLWYQLSKQIHPVFIVNRLDRETSGLLVVAKNKMAAKDLSRHRFKKHRHHYG